jgi:geranylgeranyl pyrophosphate synthase
MIAWVSSGGIHRPKQVGHPGHPSPEPVARTSPPAVMSKTVEAVVAIVSFWKRVIVRARARANDSSTPPAGGRRCRNPVPRWHTACVPTHDRTAPAPPSTAIEAVRGPVDLELERFLGYSRAELAGMDPSAVALADELLRLLGAGGKRIRPALCFWAFRAAGGGEDDPIVPACAALELLHTAALVHDDLMDRDAERRGVDATHVRFAKEAPVGVDPDAFGKAAAVLVGDLALVLSERLLRTSRFGTGRLEAAMARFDRMRAEMAAGQFLDVSGSGDRARVRALKTGSYTAEGPVMIGAALAGAGPQAEGPLRVFGRLVGEAFQLRDDLADGDSGTEAVAVEDLVARATRSLGDAPLRRDGIDALVQIAELLRAPGAA